MTVSRHLQLERQHLTTSIQGPSCTLSILIDSLCGATESHVWQKRCVRSARGSRRGFPTVGLVASGGSKGLRVKDLCIITDKLNNIL